MTNDTDTDRATDSPPKEPEQENESVLGGEKDESDDSSNND